MSESRERHRNTAKQEDEWRLSSDRNERRSYERNRNDDRHYAEEDDHNALTYERRHRHYRNNSKEDRRPTSRASDEEERTRRKRVRRSESPTPYQRSSQGRDRRGHYLEAPPRTRRRRSSSSSSRSSESSDTSYERRQRLQRQQGTPQEAKCSSRRGGEDHEERRRRSSRPRSRSRQSRHRAEKSPRREEPHSPPPTRRRKRSRSPEAMDKAPPAPYKRASGPLPSQQAAYKGDESATGNGSGSGALDKPVEKQKPTFAASGKLAAETNTVTGTTIVLKYNEPPEARKPAPSVDWRLFEFKGGEQIGKALQLGQRSCWLFGRERAVVDYPIEHPSCSKQHAVLQFRWVEKRDEFGERRGAVKPYVIDLDSANGTRVNGEAIEGRRFVEVRSGDVLAFGDSTREYVVLLSPPT